MSVNLSEILGREGLENNLLNKLGKLAEANGTVSIKDLNDLAGEFLIGKANAYGTTSFYDFLKPENWGKKVYVCNGTSCVCAGTQENLAKELKKYFKEDEIGHMTCLGRCHENSAFHVNGKNYSGASIGELDAIIHDESQIKQDHYQVRAAGKQFLTSPFTTIGQYYSPFIEALKSDPLLFLNEIKVSALRGRGGNGFPVWLKLELCSLAEGDTKFIICNGDEGDPGAYSDRYLLEQRPHSVLFGMLIAGLIAKAKYGVIYIRAEYPEAAQSVEKAIDELRLEGLIGNQICGSQFDFDFKIVLGQGSYICGEETALIKSVEGQRPEVRIRPPYPVHEGLFNKPTVVNNVETLAAFHTIVEYGGLSWKAIGTQLSTGTKLVCLDGMFNNPGIVEVEMGFPLTVLVNDWGGGFKKPVKALQIGGPLGGLVPVSKMDQLTIDFESFAENGFLLGHASIVCLPEDFPVMEFIGHLLGFAASESCGKCFPCRLGTKRGHELVIKALKSDCKIDKYLFDDLLNTLEKGSLCAHGGGIPLPVRNAMEYFKTELDQYFI